MPKGIAISHQNLIAGARIVSQYLDIQQSDRILSVLPFSFDYGLNQLLTTVQQRAVLVLQRSTLAAHICRSLAHYEITGLAGVPTMWAQLMLPSSPLPTTPVPALRYITNSGGAFPVELVRQYRALLQHTRVFLMYGLTEAFRSTYLCPDELERRPHSMGKAIPECEVLVVTDDGRECAPNEVGELVHAGPTVSLGYWRDAEATAAKFRPHPFRPGETSVYSGDYVTRDDDGFLYFIGRRDEMMKSSGYRISPTEVEALLYQSGLVAEVVVKARPDPLAGAVIVAYCVPKQPASFSAGDLLEFCRREMPGHMIPRDVQVLSELPRTASGKIDRKLVA